MRDITTLYLFIWVCMHIAKAGIILARSPRSEDMAMAVFKGTCPAHGTTAGHFYLMAISDSYENVWLCRVFAPVDNFNMYWLLA